MMYGYGAGFGLGGWLGMLGMIALVVGVVVLIVWLVGRTTQGAQPQGPGAAGHATTGQQPDALEVLRLRLARGEITIEEYTATKQALEAGR